MRFTWKDGITTLTMGAAVVLDRAYFNSWDWPLVNSTRWVVIGLALLAAIGLTFGFLLDKYHDLVWAADSSVIAGITLVLTGLGLAYAASDYVVLLMLDVVVLWVASLAQHAITPTLLKHKRV